MRSGKMRVGFRAIGEVSRITRQTPRRNVMSPSKRLKSLFMLAVNPFSRTRYFDASLRLRIDRSAMSSSAILNLESYATSVRAPPLDPARPSPPPPCQRPPPPLQHPPNPTPPYPSRTPLQLTQP